MIRVNFGNNTVYATLSERAELSNVVLKLDSLDGVLSKIFIVSNITNAGDRVNALSFELVVEADEDLLNGLVYLDKGDYNYTFYNNDTLTTDLTNAVFLEKGLLKYDTDLVSTDYDSSQTEYIYNG